MGIEHQRASGDQTSMKAVFGVVFSSLLAVLVTAAEPSKPHAFQIRLVLDKPTADSERMKLVYHHKEGQTVPIILNVARETLLDESDIQFANLQTDTVTGNPQVGVTFTDKGKKAFDDVTKTNLNRKLAILVDGKVVAAPVIRDPISAGRAVIDGKFTQKEAEDIVNRINKVVQENQKGQLKPWTHGPYDAR